MRSTIYEDARTLGAAIYRGDIGEILGRYSHGALVAESQCVSLTLTLTLALALALTLTLTSALTLSLT